MAHTITRVEFEAHYRSVAPELAGYLRRQGATDVEDLVADVFTTAWRRRADLPPPVLRRAWLFGAARRLLLADLRRKRQNHLVVTELVTCPPHELDDAPESDDQNVIVQALGRLPDAQRELLQLAEWERLTPAEIAVVLKIRPGPVRQS